MRKAGRSRQVEVRSGQVKPCQVESSRRHVGWLRESLVEGDQPEFRGRTPTQQIVKKHFCISFSLQILNKHASKQVSKQVSIPKKGKNWKICKNHNHIMY